MKVERYPYPARAWWGDVKVAESDACLCLESDGEPPVLYFPRDAIDLSCFTRSAASSAVIESWSIGPDGDDVLTVVAASRPDGLAGHGTFDPDRVRMDVVDRRPGTADRDITVKRFPPWGDASHLIDVLDVRPDGDLRYMGLARSDGRRPVVEGSQMLAQSIVAAGRHATDRRPVGAGMMFLRPADAGGPLRFELEEVSAGRTFTGLSARVLQDGRCCAAGTILLDTTAPEVIHHEVSPPAVPGPYECPPYDMGVTGRDLRIVDGAYTGDPDAPVGPPSLDCWVRFREVPADPVIHAGLLAQFTGHMPIAAALRPHAGIGQDQAHRSLSTAINAINLSVHREIKADDWMLYHHLSTFAGDGMTHAECRVHAEGGELLASFTVEAMVRPFPGADPARDERTAL